MHTAPSLSQITTQYDKVKAVLIDNLLPEILRFDVNKSDYAELRPCFEFQKLHFTHID